MQNYEVHIQVQVTDVTKSYDTKRVVSFSITEKLPTDVDTEKFIRQRLADELKKTIGHLDAPIDNKTENFDELTKE